MNYLFISHPLVPENKMEALIDRHKIREIGTM